MIALSNKVVIFSPLLLSLGSGSNDFFEEVPVPDERSSFWPSADFPDECTSNPAMCDDAECDGFDDEDIQAAGVGFYRYVTVDANGKKWGHQYYLCSCQSNTTREFYSRREIKSGAQLYAESICKIDEVQIPLPENSTESCSDLNIFGRYDTEEERESNEHGCHRHCNDVIFEGWFENILALPEGEQLGLVGVTSTSGEDHVCRCHWGNLAIEGCITPKDYYVSSGYAPRGAVMNHTFWLVGSAAGAAVAIAAFLCKRYLCPTSKQNASTSIE